MKQLNIIVYISSVIYFKDNPLSYSKTRSSFSPQERLQQTIKTIQSVRQYIPNAYIILIESGIQGNGLEIIKELVEEYMYIGENKCIRRVVDSPYKGAGEIISLLYALGQKNDHSYNYIVKISGRYWINEKFNISEFFVNNKFSFLKKGNSYSTRLYNLSSSKKYYWILLLCISFCISFVNISIETLFYYLIPSCFLAHKKELGVSGFIGVNGESIDE